MNAQATYLNIEQIRIDGGTQSRAVLNQEIIHEYSHLFKDNLEDILPPIKVFFDGKDHWLADGFHRLEGAKQSELKSIKAIVEQGTRREAILFSVGANAEHGLRRNADDKRRAVTTLLNDNEWQSWSDNQIAKQCKVSQPFVSQLRKSLAVTYNVISNEPQTRTYTRNGKTCEMAVDNIGKPADSIQEKCPNTIDMIGQYDNQSEPLTYNVISEEEKPIELNELDIGLYSEQKEIEDLKNQKSVLNEEIASLTFQKGQLEKQLGEANQKIDALTETNNKLFSANERLTCKLKESDDGVDELQNQNHILSVKYDRIYEEDINFRRKQFELERNIKDLEDQVSRLSEENNDLQATKERNIDLIIENEKIRNDNNTLELKHSDILKSISKTECRQELIEVRNILQSELEKGIKKREGIRINKILSETILRQINKALGEQS